MGGGEDAAGLGAWVTCGSPSGTRVVSGARLASRWLHRAPLGRRLRLSVHFFGKLSLPDHSFIARGHSGSRDEGRGDGDIDNIKHSQQLDSC